MSGEVSSFHRRPCTTTAPSVSANMSLTNAPTFSQGLRRVRRCSNSDICNDEGYARSYRKKLRASKASPYLIFNLITTDNLLEIERGRERGEISRGVRMTHYVDWNILIVKVPTAEHELSHGKFRRQIGC
jgi:hypothetical protein